jgi:hypothetical protein
MGQNEKGTVPTPSKIIRSSISTVALLPSGQAGTESCPPSFDAGSLSVVGPVGTSPTEALLISF